MEKLHISDCALVICSKEQEEAVNMIAEDVAMVKVSGQGEEETEDEKGMDTQLINAAEYKM